ncbi:MAG: YqaA family protein [Candidatus Omnitrophota bacterium]
MLRSMGKWTIEKFMPYGPLGLFVLAFCESSFFPIPPDILLIALALADPEASFYLAGITTLASVLGAMLGYFIGLKGGRPVLRKFISEEKILKVHDYFSKYDVWAIGIAGFTPIPYKVFTIAGGVFYINFFRFILVSVLSRGARFFLVGGTIYFFGPTVKVYLQKYFNLFSILFIVLLFMGFYIAKIALKKGKGKK